jgi:hypothetical protein
MHAVAPVVTADLDKRRQDSSAAYLIAMRWGQHDIPVPADLVTEGGRSRDIASGRVASEMVGLLALAVTHLDRQVRLIASTRGQNGDEEKSVDEVLHIRLDAGV